MIAVAEVEEAPRDVSGRFLSGHAYSPHTQFKRGEHAAPETEIRTGQRLSPRTEWKRGQAAHNKLPVGSTTIRTDRSGRQRAFVKVAEPNVWAFRAVHVWESVHGKVPRGMLVHHVDHDTLNDDIDNLTILTRAQHIAEHRAELLAARGIGAKP